jgi:hypothetical protein
MDIFTPQSADRTFRHEFDMADVELLSGSLDTRKQGVKAKVRISGKIYKVKGVSCGLPGCNCDAVLIPNEK